MAMNKSGTIVAFHNQLSMLVKNLVNNTEVSETRPNRLTSLFRFKTETQGLNYVIQTVVKTTATAYNIDVAVIEENVDEKGEVKAELVDDKTFIVNELGMKDNGVKLVIKYIRGAVKAVVMNEEQVFDENEAADTQEYAPITAEFEFAEYLVVQTTKRTEIKHKINRGGKAPYVTFSSDSQPEKTYVLLIEVRHDEDLQQYRVHITTVEKQVHDMGEMSCVRTEHDIPVKSLNKDALDNGVILACFDSNISKIETALEGKEVNW